MTLTQRYKMAAFAILVLMLAMILARPAIAQQDPSGNGLLDLTRTGEERLAGAEIGDYLGLPINQAAPRRRPIAGTRR